MDDSYKKIDTLLRRQSFSGHEKTSDRIYCYAECLAMIEKSIVVVSDLQLGSSRIYHGGFSETLGLNGTSTEQSIWEKEVFRKLSAEELERKYIAELRFYNYLRKVPMSKRKDLYLAAHISFLDRSGSTIDVFHRMYYIYEEGSEAIRFGICIYSPLFFNIPSKCMVIDSLTGRWEELTSENDNDILSAREKQVLSLIEQGFTSRDIADRLCISKHTVSRHRQEILAKLQVKNSTEACRRAKLLKIL